MGEPYYKTQDWLRLRALRLQLDHHTCIVPSCGKPAVTVITSSAAAMAALTQSKTRAHCRRHDNQDKEGTDGKRKSGGKLGAIDCDAQDRPRDLSRCGTRDHLALHAVEGQKISQSGGLRSTASWRRKRRIT